MGRRPPGVGYVAAWCTPDGASRASAARSAEELLRFALGDTVADERVRTHTLEGTRAHMFLAARVRESGDPTLKQYVHELRRNLLDRGGLILVVSMVSSDPAAAAAAQSRALREGMRRLAEQRA